MIPPETYLQFHLVFILPVIALLLVLTWRRNSALDGWSGLAGVGLLIVVAVVYTTPWDNLLIEQGVWWYGEDVVWHTIWAAPVGEYLFFILQPLITLLFLALLPLPTDTDLTLSGRDRALGVAGGVTVSVIGATLLLSGDSWLYFGSMLLWGGPVLAIQWGFGWTHLWRARRTVAVAIAVPTVYLWVADWSAITLGLWTISETYTIGIAPFGFPFEEAFFFFLTNVFLVQGFVLYVWLIAQWPPVKDSPWVVRYTQLLPRRRTHRPDEQ